MNAFDYAQLEDALDYLYDFLYQDLADRVRTEREPVENFTRFSGL